VETQAYFEQISSTTTISQSTNQSTQLNKCTADAVVNCEV